MSENHNYIGKPIICIAAPSNLGLKKMDYADAMGPGVRKMPAVFKSLNFADRIHAADFIEVPPPEYQNELDESVGVRNYKSIIEYSEALSETIRKAIDDNYFPIVIGGDCSILLASALALKQKGTYGLAYIDGHTDFGIANVSSVTGGAAGMDLAIVTGRGPGILTNMGGIGPYFEDANIAQFGNRDDDDDYNRVFFASRIFKADLRQLRTFGIRLMVTHFLESLNERKIDGIWIHLDVDVLHNDVMPAVDSPQPDGLSYSELKELLHALLKSNKIIGMQITIYDPDLDPDLVVGTRLVDELVEVINVQN
jgi:arginase